VIYLSAKGNGLLRVASTNGATCRKAITSRTSHGVSQMLTTDRRDKKKPRPLPYEMGLHQQDRGQSGRPADDAFAWHRHAQQNKKAKQRIPAKKKNVTPGPNDKKEKRKTYSCRQSMF